ncbi:MAG: LysR family transcriptional regulator [Chromatiales bacterium]|nr:LysR family transcriptional regulator [Chromatiales bacterium]
MDTEQARTFLAIAAHGSFLEAAKRLYVTQSTVSARVRSLEEELGSRLFVRNRSGASLTPAGRRFLGHAKNLILTVEQARHDVGLPERYRATLRVGGRIALWEGFLPSWVDWMRERAPDVSLRGEIGFEEDLMRRLVEGTLDIGLMYTPSHSPGLVVEHLFDDTLVLVSTHQAATWPDENYVYVDWGPGFYAKHASSFPNMEAPAQVVNIGWLGVQLIVANGGSCYLPERMARPLTESGRMFRVSDTPAFSLPAYMVYTHDAGGEVQALALAGLRDLAAAVRT